MTTRDDIRRVFAITWREAAGLSLPITEVSRIWSLDNQWMTPSEAEAAIAVLTESGWLRESEERVEPTIKYDEVQIPLGWWPDPKNLISPPPLKAGVEDRSAEVAESVSTQEVQPRRRQIEPVLTRQERRLLRYVAHKSGLAKDEVLRRCERKRRALGPATAWICILLVAKEQGLEMEDISHEA